MNKKSKTTPMTIDSAARIRSAEATKNGGKIASGGFGARADAVAQKHVVAASKAAPIKKTK
jgi:hypothetical protein